MKKVSHILSLGILLALVSSASAQSGGGSVVAWGRNNFGQTNLPAGLTNVTALGKGSGWHSVVLKSDGTVVAWGLSDYGQTNVPPGLSNVKAVSGGGLNTMALKTDGTIVTWGDNHYGQTTIPAGLGIVTAIGAHSTSVVLKSTGTVVAWGWNGYGEANVPADLSGVTAIAAAGFHIVALKSDATVVAWGASTDGQTTVPAGLSGVTAIAGGGWHTVALKSNGTVVAWGNNQYGQANVPPGLNNVIAISAGDYHTVALKRDGTMVAWGDNTYGQTTVPAGLGFVSAINSGTYHNVALVTPLAITQQPQSLLVAAGGTTTFTVTAMGVPGLSYQWRKEGVPLTGATNTFLTLIGVASSNAGNYDVVVSNPHGSITSSVATLTVELVGFKPTIMAQPTNQAVVSGSTASFGVTATGTDPLSYQWLKDGRLLVGATNAAFTLAHVGLVDSGTYSVAVSNGLGLTLSSPAMLTVGNPSLLAMGYNALGQLGTGTTTNPSLPVVVTNGVVAAAGLNHSLFVKPDGTLWTMGLNSSGQLGTGTTVNSLLPINIASNASGVAAGGNHSLFVKPDGTLWTMGLNSSGQLGDGTTTNSRSPLNVASNVVAVAAGVNCSFFVKADGTLWAMGQNSSGQLGNGTTTNVSNPVSVASNVVAVAAGQAHALFLKVDGSLWAMGLNSSGQLGNGTAVNSALPVTVASNVVAVAAGANHSLFVTADGALWAMGGNGNGQVGNGTTTSVSSPVSVASNVVAVTGGRLHSLFSKTDGSLWAMGGNFYGQLGSGDTVNSAIPLRLSQCSAAVIAPASMAYHSLFIGERLTVPQLVGSPESVSVLAGSAVSLGVTAQGSPVLAYQWWKDGLAVGGATNATLSFPNTQLADSGNYVVVVTNTFGSVTSSIATLTVSEWVVSTLAGSGVVGLSNGPALQASFNGIDELKVLPNGSMDVLVVDAGNNNVRSISGGLNPEVNVYAGSQNGSAGTALGSPQAVRFNLPLSVAIGPLGEVYVADTFNYRIVKLAAGTASVLAGSGAAGITDGTGTEASFDFPNDLAVDSAGNVFVSEFNHHVIRKITPSGVVTRFAGDGTAGHQDGEGFQARFNKPGALAIDLNDNLYVGEYVGNRVRKITPAGFVTTVAGSGVTGYADGMGTNAQFNTIASVCLDNEGNLYVGDLNRVIRRITPSGLVQTIAGQGGIGFADGLGRSALFRSPSGMGWHPDGSLLVADDSGSERIRRVVKAVSPLAPSLVQQPQRAIVSNGATAFFKTAATGSWPLSYQWFKEGAALPGQTGPSLILTNVQMANEGAYQVVVANPYGSITSSVAVLDYIVPAEVFVASAVAQVGQPVTVPIRLKSLGAENALGFSLAFDPAVLTFQTAQLGSNAIGGYLLVNQSAASSGQLGLALTLPSGQRFAAGTQEVFQVTFLAGTSTNASGSLVTLTDNPVNRELVDELGGSLPAIWTGSSIFFRPVFTLQPQSQTITQWGGDFTIVTAATGTAPLTYSWLKNGELLVNETGATLSRNPAAVVDGGQYVLVVTNPYGSATSAVVQATIQLPPQLTLQPESVSVLAGSAVSLGVTAQGSPVLAYQWWKDGLAVGGATNATLSFPNTQLADSGNYVVVVTNTFGSVTSSIATLTVSEWVVSTLAGSGVVGLSNGPALQASFNGIDELKVLPNGSMDVLVVDAGNNNVRSISGGLNPEVNVYAGSQNGSAGTALGSPQAVRFNLPLSVAIGPLGEVYVADTFNYRIVKLAAGTASVLAGSGAAGITDGTGTEASFDFPNDLAVDSAGNVFVSEFNHHVIRKITPSGVVTRFAGDGTAGHQDGEGFQARFNKPGALAIDLNDNLYVGEYVGNRVRKITPAGFVTTVAGSGVTGYADGMGTNAQFNTIASVCLDNEGNLYVGDLNRVIRRITPSGLVQTIAGQGGIGFADGLGRSALFRSPSGMGWHPDGSLLVADDSGSERIRRVVKAVSPLAPSLVQQPQRAIVSNGATAFFKTAATGSWPLSYQWFKEGAALPGQTGPSLILTNVQMTNEGAYQVVVANPYGSITSSVAQVSLTPNLVTSPINQSVLLGGDVNFAVVAEGSAPLRFQWRREGEPVAGQTNSLLALTSVTTNAAGAYDVVVSNPYGSVTSGVATLTVNVPVYLLSQPTNLLVWSGGSAVFSVTAGGTPLLTYQWRKSGSNLPGANAASFTLANVTTNDNGNYDVVAANAYGSVTSSVVTLTVPWARLSFNSATQMAGVNLEVPLQLNAVGNESAIGLSVTYDPTRLQFVSAQTVSSAPSASLLLNTSQTNSGRIGIGWGLSGGATLAAGPQELVRLIFTSSTRSNTVTTGLGFGDAPVPREVVNVTAVNQPAVFTAGSITLSPTLYEGDVIPRNQIDGVVRIADWVQVGRFVAGLDNPTNSGEFQRADCAPRTTAGDGLLAVTDWVQAGRYAVSLDASRIIGGPVQPTSFGLSSLRVANSETVSNQTARFVRLNPVIGLPGQLLTATATLEALGDESALGLSVTFDATRLVLQGIRLGRDVPSGANLVLNTNQSGRVGVLVSLPFGQAFTSGTKQFLQLDYQVTNTLNATLSLVIGDAPVVRQIADATALALAANYQNGVVTVLGQPTLQITETGGNVQLRWPAAYSNFLLQSTYTLGSNWTVPAHTPQLSATNYQVTLPATNNSSYFRLQSAP